MKDSTLFFPGWGIPLDFYPFDGVDYHYFDDTHFDFRLSNFSAEGVSTVAGHSMGTLHALAFAAMHPNVSHVVLYAPFVRFIADEKFPQSWPESDIVQLAQMVEKNPKAALRHFWRNAAHPGANPIVPPEFLNVARLRGGLDFLHAFSMADLRPDLVSKNFTVIYSEADRVVTPEMTRTFLDFMGIPMTVHVSDSASHLSLCELNEFCEYNEASPKKGSDTPR